MVVRAGREFLAIPGPTTMPDEVLRAMHRPALDIYSDTMVQLTDGLLRDLSRLFATSGNSYIYIANGHGAWEAVLSNVLSRGDRILVLESGRFALNWGHAAAAMGVEVESIKGDWRRAVRPAEVEARLRQDKAHTIKAILTVQVDTASGAYNDIAAIGAAIKASGHPALLYRRCGGLARLHAVRDGCMGHRRRHVRLAERADDAARPRLRRRQRSRPRGPQESRSAHAILGLDRAGWSRALPQIRRHRAGASVVRAAPGAGYAVRGGARKHLLRHRLLAEAVRRAVAKWSEGQVLGFNIAEPLERSNTVTTVTVADGYDPDRAAALLQPEMRRRARQRHRRSVRAGVPRCPYGPRQCADDPGNSWA